MLNKGNRESLSNRSAMSLHEAAAFLEELAGMMREGRLTLEDDVRRLHLAPAEYVNVTVEGQRRQDKEHLKLKIAWRQGLKLPGGLKIRGL